MWLKYFFGNEKKLTKIRVNYSLITKSGKEMFDIPHDIIPKNTIIRNYKTFSWDWDNDMSKLCYKEISKIAGKILNTFQKKQRNKLIKNKCILDGGDYIVGCTWDVSARTEDISYKEFKDYENTNKETN